MIFVNRGTEMLSIRYLPSIRSKSDLFTASIVPLLARIPYHKLVRRKVLD